MAVAKKVYDYNADAVRDRLTGALRKRRGEATVADLVAATGLPKAQVDAELPAVADEFSGRLAVTESGEILYSFPRGFSSRYRGLGPSLKRGWKAFKKGAAAVGTVAFKAWIMVMLVGYFALFVALALLAVVASFAMSASGGDRDSGSRGRRGGGLGGMYMVSRLFDLIFRIWFYNEAFKSPYQRRHEADARTARRAGGKPLHKAIFSFVFGEPDPNAGLDEAQKRAFAAMVRAKNGIVILEDFMALTGLPPAKAELEISRYLYEFEGSPEASEQGTVYYRFDALMRRAQADELGAADSSLARLRPFSGNKKTANTWYAVINGANLLFGSYFLFNALSSGYIADRMVTGFTYFYWFVTKLLGAYVTPEPLGLVLVGLGAVPAAFSLLFWLVPAVRAGKLKRENERVKEANLRRIVYAQAVSSPGAVSAPAPSSLPDIARPADAAAATRVVEELAAYESGEPSPDGRAWRLRELERKLADIETVRRSARTDRYDLGGVAFDTDR